MKKLLLVVLMMSTMMSCKKEKEDGPDERLRMWAVKEGITIEWKTSLNGQVLQNWRPFGYSDKTVLERGDVWKLEVRRSIDTSNPAPSMMVYSNSGPTGAGNLVAQVIALQYGQTYAWTFVAP